MTQSSPKRLKSAPDNLLRFVYDKKGKRSLKYFATGAIADFAAGTTVKVANLPRRFRFSWELPMKKEPIEASIGFSETEMGFIVENKQGKMTFIALHLMSRKAAIYET